MPSLANTSVSSAPLFQQLTSVKLRQSSNKLGADLLIVMLSTLAGIKAMMTITEVLSTVELSYMKKSEKGGLIFYGASAVALRVSKRH